jgi:polyisoprenoid-binding protein YceI
MKNSLFPMLVLMVSFGVSVFAQKYDLVKSEMKISGTSSLHDWTSDANSVRTSANLSLGGEQGIDLKSLKVEVPVDKIKSPKGKIMDNKTYEALKMEQHPLITFDLVKIISRTKTADGIKLVADGNLKIAGVTKLRRIEALAKIDDSGKVSFKGSHSISLKDFNMEPPTALMGSIKTGEAVMVSFDVILSPSVSVSANTK